MADLFFNIICKFFDSCNFVLVRRELNSAAHFLAKFAAVHKSPICCNFHLLHAAVLDACKKDAAFALFY